MAKGLTAAIDRFQEVISSRLTGWKSSEQRISDLAMSNQLGLDKRYFVKIESRSRRPAAVSNVSTVDAVVLVQLARGPLGGTKHGYDDESLRLSLADAAFEVEENLSNPNNYDYDHTGIILVNLDDVSGVAPEIENGHLIWESRFIVKIRQSSAAITI